jgi:hypothetical protein
LAAAGSRAVLRCRQRLFDAFPDITVPSRSVRDGSLCCPSLCRSWNKLQRRVRDEHSEKLHAGDYKAATALGEKKEARHLWPVIVKLQRTAGGEVTPKETEATFRGAVARTTVICLPRDGSGSCRQQTADCFSQTRTGCAHSWIN